MSPTRTITVVADYDAHAAEGINVVSRTLVDDLRAAGHAVDIVAPETILKHLPRMILRSWTMRGTTVFTHGPGPRTVLATAILRRLTRSRLVWIATRPDLENCPKALRGRRTAHHVLCNRPRPDLATVAPDAQVIVQPIGIAPERLTPPEPETPVTAATPVTPDPIWAELRAKGVPVALHVGHLRRTRGLEQLVAVKTLLGDKIEVVILASPKFEPDPGTYAMLTEAGVRVHRAFVAHISDAYKACDLYLFPPPPEQEGAIELPLSVLEALACQRPVVATPFGALPIALDGIEGVTFAAPAEFAQAVARCLEDGLPDLSDGLPDRLNAHRLAEVIGDIHSEA